jgi:hypothetical protein
MQVFPSNKFPARPGNVAALSVRLATKIKVAPLGESSRSLLIESRGEDASWSVLDACGVASYLRSINSRRVDNRLSARTGGVQDGRQDKALLQKLTLAILSVDRSSFERTLEKLVPMSTSERELMASSFLSHCVQIKAGTGSGIRPHLQKDRPGTVQIGLTSWNALCDIEFLAFYNIVWPEQVVSSLKCNKRNFQKCANSTLITVMPITKSFFVGDYFDTSWKRKFSDLSGHF